MEKFMKIFIAILIFVQSIAFAGINEERRTIGKSIQNKRDNTVLELRCLESNTFGDCSRMQYYLRRAEISDPVGPELFPNNFFMTPNELKEYIANHVNLTFNKKEIDPYTLTNIQYEYRWTDDVKKDYFLYTLVAVAELAVFAVAIFVPGAQLVFVPAVIGLMGAGAPTLDLIILPFKAIGSGIQNSSSKMKIKRLTRKETRRIKKAYKKLFKVASENPGMQKVNNKTFNMLLETIENLEV